MVAKRLEIISEGLGTLGGAWRRWSRSICGRCSGSSRVNGPLKIIVDTLPVIAGKARLVVRKATGG